MNTNQTDSLRIVLGDFINPDLLTTTSIFGAIFVLSFLIQQFKIHHLLDKQGYTPHINKDSHTHTHTHL